MDNEFLRKKDGEFEESTQPPHREKGDLEPLENQGSDDPETDEPALTDKLAFEKINSVTIKVTDGRGSNAWSGDRGRGYRTTRAVAWLMAVGGEMWVCRYRNRSSRPMRLTAAKKYVLEVISGMRPGRKIADPIKRLNQLYVDAIEPMPTLAEVVAIERANFPPSLTWAKTEGPST